MAQDKSSFTKLSTHEALDPVMKAYVLSYSLLVACGFRDIEVARFLTKNTTYSTNASINLYEKIWIVKYFN